MTARKAAAVVRKPQDRKLKSAPTGPKPPEGAELLRPVAEIPVWDQEELLVLFTAISDATNEDGEVDNQEGVRAITRGAKALSKFAYDEAEWIKFCSGSLSESLPRVGAVVTWYLDGEMGNSEPSAS